MHIIDGDAAIETIDCRAIVIKSIYISPPELVGMITCDSSDLESSSLTSPSSVSLNAVHLCRHVGPMGMNFNGFSGDYLIYAPIPDQLSRLTSHLQEPLARLLSAEQVAVPDSTDESLSKAPLSQFSVSHNLSVSNEHGHSLKPRSIHTIFFSLFFFFFFFQSRFLSHSLISIFLTCI